MASTSEGAAQMQADLAGLSGPEAQQAMIEQIEMSPEFQETVRQGEEAMLQRASATGGLRGGNLQGALAQFRPQMLTDAISRKYSQLGGLAGRQAGLQQYLGGAGQTALQNLASGGQAASQNLAQLGQAAAAGQAAGGLQSAGAVTNMMQNIGAAQAGAHLAGGQAAAQGWQTAGGALRDLGMMRMMNQPSTNQPPVQKYGDYGSGMGMMRRGI